ncbi:hypothetical protein LTS17_008527 [Exophiala oligosperma]
MSDNGKDGKARESFASILSYYQHNRKSLENVPTWGDRPDSGTIMIALAKDTVPSADQTEKNKRKLKELLAAQEAIDKLSPLERQIMSQAANSSKARRSRGVMASSRMSFLFYRSPIPLRNREKRHDFHDASDYCLYLHKESIKHPPFLFSFAG